MRAAAHRIVRCREPLPGLHERYVATRCRQVLGSTMHFVAGDGVGILAGAVIASLFQRRPWQTALENGSHVGRQQRPGPQVRGNSDATDRVSTHQQHSRRVPVLDVEVHAWGLQ